MDMDARVRVRRRLVELGWVATRRQLLAVAPRGTVDPMLADGSLHRVARGRYAVAQEQPARVAAHRLAGVAAYQSAAQSWVRVHADGRFVAQVDLADERLRIVIEADSFEFHGDRQLFDRDCRRYDELVADGWLVLRFSWEQVMTRPVWVRQMLLAAVAQRAGLCRAGTRRPTSEADDVDALDAFERAEVVVLGHDGKPVGGRGRRDPQVVDVDVPAACRQLHPQARPFGGDQGVDWEEFDVGRRLQRA